MTPEEIEYFRSLGHAFIGDLALVSTYSVLYGIFFLLFAISTSNLFRRGVIRRSVWVMFTVTLITFLLSTMNVAAEIAGFSIFLRLALLDNVSFPLGVSERLTANGHAVFAVIAQWNANIVPLISDIIVIWRAWVLFPEKRRVMIAPLCLFLGGVGTSLVYLGIISNSKVADSVFRGPFDSSTKMLSLATIAISMVTNAVTSLLIAYNLWARRKTDLNRPAPEVHRLRISTSLVVESGFLLLCFQFIQLIAGRSRPLQSAEGEYLTWLVFNAIYYGFSAMYPTIVIFLVHNHHSISDLYERNFESEEQKSYIGSRSSLPATAGHLSFTVPPSPSSIYSESVISADRSFGVLDIRGAEHPPDLEKADADVKEKDSESRRIVISSF